jgi:hypothetical protein
MRVIHYKVRHRTTGLYSKGTGYNQWDAKGKTFDTIGKLRSFITRCMKDSYMSKFLGDFQIIEFEVQEIAVRELSEIVKPEKIMELLKA